tara:strand:+ start:533 stop:814 length:282 start_codon:yes stop_codon:yes gene_type:complete
MLDKFKGWFYHMFVEATDKPEDVKASESFKQKEKEPVLDKPVVKKKVAKPVRTRTIKGRYKADDLTTDDVNEAWVGGKAPMKNKPRIIRKKSK